MTQKRLVPYNLYLHEEHVDKLKKLAKKRQASSMIRDAISMMLDGKDQYTAGYNRGLKDATEVVDKCREIEMIAIKGKYLADVLIDQMKALEKKK
jgi:predicted transcriptional regulator